MPSPRIKGQEVEVLMVANGVPQETITNVRSFEVAAQLEMLREGYLGEGTDRRDEVFRGVRGRMELHFDSKDVLTLISSLIERAKRRVPGFKVNVKATLNFPGGDRPRVLIQDCHFGEAPINFAGRTEYGTITLEFEAQDISVVN